MYVPVTSQFIRTTHSFVLRSFRCRLLGVQADFGLGVTPNPDYILSESVVSPEIMVQLGVLCYGFCA